MVSKEEGQEKNCQLYQRKEPLLWNYNWADQVACYTLLVDGAWKANKIDPSDPGTTAYGWVLQSRNEDVDKGGHIINASSADQAEALAIYLSLKEMLKRNIEVLDIWTYSKTIVDGLREENKTLSSIKKNLLSYQIFSKMLQDH